MESSETGYVEVKYQDEFDGFEKDEKDALVEAKKKDQKALYMTFQAIEEPIFTKISCANIAHEAWEILQKSYKGDD